MGKIQMLILLMAVVLFTMLTYTDGSAAYSVQEHIPGWIQL